MPTPYTLPNYSSTPSPIYNTGASGLMPAAGMNLTNLNDYINQLNRTGQSAALGARIPGGPALEATSSGNIASELRGEVPADVIRLLQQQGAERGIRTGSPSNASYLQALGLTSIARQEQGQRDLTAAEGRNPAAPLYDPATQLITPYQEGMLQLGQQSEADRAASSTQQNALQAQEIALRGQQAAGGSRFAPSGAPAPTTGTGTTAPGLYLPGRSSNELTQSWWANTFGTPYGQTPNAATGPGYTYMGENIDPSVYGGYDQLFDLSAYEPGGDLYGGGGGTFDVGPLAPPEGGG